MKEWAPLHPDNHHSFQLGNYGILILNREITMPQSIMEPLWKNATIRSTADGGTDRWFQYVEKEQLNLSTNFPDTVSGDFDSINPKTLELCEKNEVYIEKTPDQNFTDFQKSLQVLNKKAPVKLDSIIIIDDHGGRIDQVFENVNTLGKLDQFLGKKDLPSAYLLGSESITWHLPAGEHKISIPQYLRDQNQWCAILPYDSKNNITTSGLKWNLNKRSVEFGGLISSSNTYNGEPVVTIRTNAGILWSMGLL